MKLLDQVRSVIRQRPYSIRTEQAYVQGIRKFILFHNKRPPKAMGEADIARFISHLATNRRMAASTQNQALNAIVFLYKQVLGIDPGDFGPMKRAKKPERLPTVLTKQEVGRVLSEMSGTYKLMAQLLYGSGLRLMECVRLRVKDIDFGQHQIVARSGKGSKDRSTVLSDQIKPFLSEQIDRVKVLHKRDVKSGFGEACRLRWRANIQLQQGKAGGRLCFHRDASAGSRL